MRKVIIKFLRPKIQWIKGSIFYMIVELALSSFAFLLLLPIFISALLAILILDGRPIFYLQKRVGKGGKKFYMIKFRTMRNGAFKEKLRWKKTNPELWQKYVDSNFKLENDPRFTKSGQFLRKYSIDELPQLINVIRGEMSLVGPRPLFPRERYAYGRRLKYYTTVKPGITGLWQTSGRSNTTFRRRIAADVVYVQKWSPCMDARIAFKTPKAVLGKTGAC